MARSLLLWALRLLLLGGIAFFLAERMAWDDAVETVSGERLVGRVEVLAGGGLRVRAGDGERTLGPQEVARRPGGDVPAVSWGLGTLARRLADRVPLVLLVLLVQVALVLATAWRWFLLMRAVDLPVPAPRALRLGYIGAFFNLAVPGSTGGDVVKAWYAARATGRGTRAVISVFMDRVLGLFGLALLAGTALLLVPGAAGAGPLRLVVLAVVVGGLLAAAVLLLERVRRRLGLTRLVARLPFRTLWAEAGAAARLYRDRPGALGAAIAISVLNHAVAAVLVWLLARALGIGGLGLANALVLVPVANLAGAVPLVPGGWGVGELAFAWLFGQVGVEPTEAVGLSVVFRLSLLVASLPGAPLWMFWRGRPSRASIAREVEAATRGIGDEELVATRAAAREEER